MTDAFEALVPLIPSPWSVDEFVQRVADQRGRPIEIRSVALTPQQATGYRVAQHDRDVIMVAESATGERRDAIVGHELAHIVLGHKSPANFESPDDMQHVVPSASSELIDRFLRHRDYLIESGALAREKYDESIEREAETFATRLVAYAKGRDNGGDATEHDRLRDRLR